MSSASVKKKHIDTTLLVVTGLLVAAGFLIFTSASLGLLAREGVRFSSVAFSQITFGIIGGGLALFLTSAIHYRYWRRFAFYLFAASLIFTALVFVPGLGMTHAGATRWLHLGPFTVQPAEFLKIAFVIYLATWLSGMYRYTHQFLKGTVPIIAVTMLAGALLLLQPDTDTFIIITVSGGVMFLVAGARLRDIGVLCGLVAAILVVLMVTRPYIMDRITTFIDPGSDPLGSSYQVQQSLIAIGSGGLFGRGFGQSIQKFEYLPEPIGDAIFAVYAEEFGFIGATLLLSLFVLFIFRGFRIASHSKDRFAMLLVVGLITLIATQIVLNIAAMVALAPMLGLTLPFVSHGGTAMLAALAAVGIVLNVSKYQRAA